jgi:hypothetical protein
MSIEAKSPLLSESARASRSRRRRRKVPGPGILSARKRRGVGQGSFHAGDRRAGLHCRAARGGPRSTGRAALSGAPSRGPQVITQPCFPHRCGDPVPIAGISQSARWPSIPTRHARWQVGCLQFQMMPGLTMGVNRQTLHLHFTIKTMCAAVTYVPENLFGPSTFFDRDHLNTHRHCLLAFKATAKLT